MPGLDTCLDAASMPPRCRLDASMPGLWYIRPNAHTNPVIPQVEPVKVDQVKRALSLKATPMHDFTSGKRLFKLQHTC